MQSEEQLIRLDRVIESLQSDIPILTDTVKSAQMIAKKAQDKLDGIDSMLVQIESLYEEQKTDSVSASELLDELTSKKARLEAEVSGLSLRVNEDSEKIRHLEETLDTLGKERQALIVEQHERSEKILEELKTEILDEIASAERAYSFSKSELEKGFEKASSIVDERTSERLETLSQEIDRRIAEAWAAIEAMVKETTQYVEGLSEKENERLTQKSKEAVDSLKIYINEVRESFTSVVKETATFRIEQAVNDLKRSGEERISDTVSAAKLDFQGLSRSLEKQVNAKLSELDATISSLIKLKEEVPKSIESSIRRWLDARSEDLVKRIVEVLKE